MFGFPVPSVVTVFCEVLVTSGALKAEGRGCSSPLPPTPIHMCVSVTSVSFLHNFKINIAPEEIARK